jgi:hypothetical protein
LLSPDDDQASRGSKGKWDGLTETRVGSDALKFTVSLANARYLWRMPGITGECPVSLAKTVERWRNQWNVGEIKSSANADCLFSSAG